MRRPDLSPWDDTDNTIETSSACVPTYFRGINQPMQPLLDPTNVSNDAMYVKNYFHRWVTVCSIPANQVQVGDYIFQVKTNSDTSRPHRGRRHLPDVVEPRPPRRPR